MNIRKSSRIILEECMGLRKNESCLIITDSKLLPIGNSLYENSLQIAGKSKLILTNIPSAHGNEPPMRIADEMLKYDVILMPTTKSLSHTRARKNATGKGARIASMPGITDSMMKRALDVNFRKISECNNFLISRLKNCDKIFLRTKKGTDVSFSLAGRNWISDDGIYDSIGAFGNLPAGEVFIAPLEGMANGVLIADASVGGFGMADTDIRIDIKDGFLAEIKGGKMSGKFAKFLKNKSYRNVAELGIGTNYKAKITGNVLEDEKVKGTCHVAFGNNRHFGGMVDVPFHVDFVIKEPEFYDADNKKII